MHYTFIIVGRESQIDLHFEPSPVFSDIATNTYFNPQVLGDNNNDKAMAMTLFPYERGMMAQMLTKFGCQEFCERNISILIIRVQNSNSANYGGNQLSNLEDCILSELLELGLIGSFINSEQLIGFRVNSNSIMGAPKEY